jgi:hypothetical protein
MLLNNTKDEEQKIMYIAMLNNLLGWLSKDSNIRREILSAISGNLDKEIKRITISKPKYALTKEQKEKVDSEYKDVHKEKLKNIENMNADNLKMTIEKLEKWIETFELNDLHNQSDPETGEMIFNMDSDMMDQYMEQKEKLNVAIKTLHKELYKSKKTPEHSEKIPPLKK